MESVPLLKDIVSLRLLEAVTPSLLHRFLRPYEGYLRSRQVDLRAEVNDAWYRHLFITLNAHDPEIPTALQRSLLAVSDLASDEALDRLMNTAKDRQLDLFEPVQTISAADAAFQAYLDDRKLFKIVHNQVQSKTARCFKVFCPVHHQPLEHPSSEVKRIVLRSRLSAFFAGRNRTEFCDLTVTESEEEVSFLIIHGQPPRKCGVIESALSRALIRYIPEKMDTIVFHRESGRLSVCAGQAVEHEFYRVLFGEVFFKDPDHFVVDEVFTVQPIYDEGAGAFETDGVFGLSKALLREIKMVDPFSHQTVTWKTSRSWSDDLAPQLDDLMKGFKGWVLKSIRLLLTIDGRSQPLSVVLIPPSVLKFDRRIGEEIVTDFLLSRGFMYKPACLALAV